MIFRRAILVAALVSLISTAGYSADCMMGRYSSDQKSYTPEHLQLPVALNWEFVGDKFDNNPASPVVEGKTCFFACGDRVYATDLETGKMLWKYPSDQPLSSNIKSTPVVRGGMIYFGSGDGNLYCLDGATGMFQWAYQTRGPIRCSPVINDGVLYFGSDDNSVYAVDATTGEAIWNKPFTAKDDMAYGLTVSLGMVIVACMDGNMYGLNASVGKLKWMYRLPSAPVRTSPLISDSVAIMALGNLVYGFTATSGQLRWVIELPSDSCANPASDGSTLYVACRDKKIYAYNLKTRQPSLKWTAPADFGTLPTSPPIVADDTLYITGSKGVVAAFSTEDGTLRWRYMIAPSLTSGTAYTDAASSPTIANSTLTVLTEDGVLHCFSPGAPDAEKPQVYEKKPANATAISAVPPFKLSAVVYDIGSGVDFSTVSLKMDNQSVEYTTDFSTSTISAIYGMPVEGKPAKRLADGVHTVKLSGKDYAGNPLEEEWVFFADSRITPPKQTIVDTGKRTAAPSTSRGSSTRGRGSDQSQNQRGGSRWGGRDGFEPNSQMSPPPPPPGPGGAGGGFPAAPMMEE